MTSASSSSSIPTIFVTGAGRRLGLNIVQHYLAQGWRVIAHYHRQNDLPLQEQQAFMAKGLYFAVQADLAQLTEVESLLAKVLEILSQQESQLDVIVHNASCFHADNSDDSLSLRWQYLEAMTRVHISAPQAMSLGLAPQIRPSGCIIAMSDIYADLPNARFASYCSAKAGLQSLALSLAQSLAPNIRVNVIQPGPIKFLPEHDSDYQAKVLSQSLLKKELGYEAVLQGLDYLISATGVTGSILKIDGGRSCANRYEQVFSG